MLAEELRVLNGEDTLWRTARPLLDAVLRMERADETFVWHGWQKSQINTFLASLPSPCSLVVGAWDTLADETQQVQDKLVLGIVCAVEQGEIRSLSTFTSLVSAGLKPIEELEIGMEDALEIMHYARRQVGPVAWALFLEKATWDEWILAEAHEGGAVDKGKLLDEFIEAGRCVVMGSRAGG